MKPSLVKMLLGGALLCCAASCGAGIVAAVAGSNNNNAPPAQPAAVSMPVPFLPLKPADPEGFATGSVFLANVQSTGNLHVVVSARDHPESAPGNQQGAVLQFRLDMSRFVELFGADEDIDGTLTVLDADDRKVAPPVTVTLLRQPRAALIVPLDPEDPQNHDHVFLSPLGGPLANLQLHVDFLHSSTGLQMWVVAEDSTGATVTRLCTNPRFDPVTQIMVADAPVTTIAGPATVFVDDPIAGRSSKIVGQVFYRPDVTFALPGQGSTAGQTRVTLIGRSLVPQSGGQPDFDHVELLFRKPHDGPLQRTVQLAPSELLRSGSSGDHLTFTMPPSPDGRPGRVDIVLRVTMRARTVGEPGGGQVTRDVVADNVFLFANPEPVFGPRGAVLDRQPVAVTPVELEAAPRLPGQPQPSTDFGVLYSEGGVAFLQLLAAQENGMFIRFGPPQQIGNPEIAAEREPRALATGDFDGDGVPDFAIANAGVTPGLATHHLVLGESVPLPPLGAIARVPAEAGTRHCRTADFDGDGLLDLLLVPAGGGGAQPHVLLSRSVTGAPQFVDLGPIAVRSFAYDAVEVADIDGDGNLDIALLGGGAQPKLDVAYGDRAGGFLAATQLDLDFASVPGYLPDAASPAVGVHAIHTAGAMVLALVFAGAPLNGQPPPHPTTPPLVVVLPQTGPRTFAAHVGNANVRVVPIEPLGTSLAANLDGIGSEELVVGVAGLDAVAVPLGLLSFNPTGPRFDGAVAILNGAERISNITGLHFGFASPADPAHSRPAVRAVFVVHSSQADGISERRLSTLLVFNNPQNNGFTLLDPDAGGSFRAGVRGCVTGNFHGISVAAADPTTGRSARDLAVATIGNNLTGSDHIDPGIYLQANDGFGGFSPSIRAIEPRILPETVTVVPSPPGQVDLLAFLTDDGRLGVWQPDEHGASTQTASHSVADLRQLLLPALRNVPLDAASVLRAADVDGDGVPDLVALLVPLTPVRAEDNAVLVVMRGRTGVAAPELPFEEPAIATPVHGNSSDFALGDFVVEPAGSPRLLELALAVPIGDVASSSNGDHVRFFRLVSDGSPGMLRWQRSFAPSGEQVLLAGNEPTRLAAADFDGNGTVDLLVAAAGDSSLRLFLNTGALASAPGEVAIGSFHQSFGSPLPTADGSQRTYLTLGDINGDGSLDVLLTTESRATTGDRSTAVAFYLSSGTGDLVGPTFVSPTRLGNRDARLAIDLGDCNGDGVPDLAVGWDTFGSGDRNVRVLFGGSR